MIMKINKVLQTPTLPCEGNNFYFVKKPDNKVDCYVSDDTGTVQYQIFNAIDLPSVDGPIGVVMGSANEYYITDFDYQANYTVTVSAGDFERVNDLITFTAPATEGTVQLTINRTVVNITVTTENTAPFINMQEKGYISPIALDSYQAIHEQLINTTILPDGKILAVVINFPITV